MASVEVHHWLRLPEAELDLILTFDPEDVADGDDQLIAEYRKWAETVRTAVENGLDVGTHNP